MKKNNLKSILGLLMMCFLFIALAPNDIQAQRQSKTRKVRKKKAVTPVRHYKKQPRRGAQVTALPRRTTVIRHRNSNYHYRDGIFYRPVNGSYIVAAPPVGIHVRILPPNPYRVRILDRSYFYYYGTYYVPRPNGGYEVVGAPLGAIVDALPDGYEVFEVDNFVYYRLDETYYKAVLEDNGNVVYQVVRV